MYIPLTFEGALQKCVYATGGLEGYFISGSQQYKYHFFTGSSNLIVNKGTIDNVEIYVIAGGGGGGNRSTSNGGGGGGGGGVNYTYNARLFQGIYTASVGAGGSNQTNGNSDGFNGATSSFIGSNLSMIANGGGGGGGTTSAGGTGGSPNGGAGGTGGTTSAGSGATGIIINVGGYTAGYGCGGGGAENTTSGVASGYSCNDNSYGVGGSQSTDSSVGAPYYGMGGGGGNVSRTGKGGGSGSIIIKYPIYDYCKDNFNDTGSCGCKQTTIDISDSLNYYPNRTGSFVYTPCGETGFVSSSIRAYFPEVICMASGSLAWVTWQGEGGSGTLSSSYFIYTANLTTPCISASYGVETCTTQSIPTASCANEKIVTFYAGTTNSGSALYYPSDSSSVFVETIPQNNVRYRCVQSGSISGLGSNATYPIQLSSNSTSASLYMTASCNTIQITSATGRGIITFCGGANSTLINPSIGSTYCIDMSLGVRPVSGFGTFAYNTLGSCLSGSFDTTTCGCP